MFGRKVPAPVLTELESASPIDFALAIIGIFPAVAVLWAVVTKSKTVAAFAQLGNLGSRGDPVLEKEQSAAARKVKSHDQACFTLGVLNVGLTTYIVGAAPQFFYLWHTPKAVVLTFVRWSTFRAEGKHFLLLDFCYFANALALVYLWVWPTAELFQILFMVCTPSPTSDLSPV